jgi:glycosyltransferase involved in cell wall biosynthesis
MVPGLLRGRWQSRAAVLFTRHVALALHRRRPFDAILSFDLITTGGVAWRLGNALGVPACGWATGSDIRANPRSRAGRGLRETLRKLDLVFYQSRELKTLGAALLGLRQADLPPDRHVVQHRGVTDPDSLPGDDVRAIIRGDLRVAEDEILILHLGRVVRGKGLFELVDGFATWAKARQDCVLVLVGAIPGWDDSAALQKRAAELPADIRGRIRILPACPPRQIWEYFKAADIFAFPSFREGMPNALLEAMLGGLPAVAFGIPAVREITQFGSGLVQVPAHDFAAFGDALLKLAADPALRRETGEMGRAIVREHFSLMRNMRMVVDRIAQLTKA